MSKITGKLQFGCRLPAALTAIVLAYDADPMLISPNGQTPMEIAEHYDHEPAQRLLKVFLGEGIARGE